MREEKTVLVVGTGALGLWIARTLCRSYPHLDVRLATGERHGGDQTLHSHGFVHAGHLYRGPMGRTLDEAFDYWADIEHGVLSDSALFAFNHAPEQLNYTLSWAENGLSQAETQAPEWMRVGSSYDLSKARCYDMAALMGGLLEDLPDGVAMDTVVTDVTLEEDGRCQVKMRSDDLAATEVFDMVVFAAGRGNAQFAPIDTDRGLDPQRIRWGKMAIVEGDLPDFYGIVMEEEITLFVATRQDDGRTIWLLSDETSPLVAEPLDMLAEWAHRIRNSLERIAPGQMGDGARWGLYWAPKSEPVTNRNTPVIFGDGPLRYVWPIKFTLSPLVARDVAGIVGTELDLDVDIANEPQLSSGQGATGTTTFHLRETWRDVPRRPWADFLENLPQAPM